MPTPALSERVPVAQTSAMPLFGVSLGIAGVHEGLFHPLPRVEPTPEASDPDVVFVHIRQYHRILKRRRQQAAGHTPLALACP